MLKVSEDGKRLVTKGGLFTVAEWQEGTLWLPRQGAWLSEDAHSLAAFIQAGPPKKRWRITRTFGKKPCVVSTDGDPTFVYSLCDSDIEEV
jgi:hypothetical protein